MPVGGPLEARVRWLDKRDGDQNKGMVFVSVAMGREEDRLGIEKLRITQAVPVRLVFWNSGCLVRPTVQHCAGHYRVQYELN